MGSCEAPSWKEARDICTKPPVSLGPPKPDCCPGLALTPADQGQEASGLLKARALGNNSPVHRLGPQREDECTQHAQKARSNGVSEKGRVGCGVHVGFYRAAQADLNAKYVVASRMKGQEVAGEKGKK